MGLMCFYTANLIVRHGYKYHDFSDLCYEHLGRPGRFLAWVGSIFVIIGALAAYTVLMGDATCTSRAALRCAVLAHAWLLSLCVCADSML